MNKHNNEYIVLFGADRYAPEFCYKACKNKFDYLKDARRFADKYENAYIFKFHFIPDGMFLDYIEDVPPIWKK